jgi:molecular chaperone GrpE (heat shock protein)
MDVGTQLDYFRKQHADFLLFLDNWDKALQLAASSEDADCLRGLKMLREMQKDLEVIRGHCRSEERNIETPYHAYLDSGQLEKLESDHHELARLVTDLFRELHFATLYQTERVLTLGREFAGFTRRHILEEEKLLGQIETRIGKEAEEKLLLRYTQSPE